jgi:5-methylcytosine-specific restriction endonuclease McrA
VPDLLYDETNNIVLACYWCNNAKTDTFTYEEFLRVGKVFAEIWKERLLK